MKFYASNIEISSSDAQYFQLAVSESKAENCPYVLLQKSFEFFRGEAYFECHDLDLAGHGRVKCSFCEFIRNFRKSN